jgi:hypothetical protein
MKLLYSMLALTLLLMASSASYAKDGAGEEGATDAMAVSSGDCSTNCYGAVNTRNFTEAPGTYDPALIKSYTDSICDRPEGTEAPAALGTREIQI